MTTHLQTHTYNSRLVHVVDKTATLATAPASIEEGAVAAAELPVLAVALHRRLAALLAAAISKVRTFTAALPKVTAHVVV